MRKFCLFRYPSIIVNTEANQAKATSITIESTLQHWIILFFIIPSPPSDYYLIVFIYHLPNLINDNRQS